MGPSLTCVRCGDRIGVYEPLVVIQPDGSAHRSSYLDAREAPVGAHDGCGLVHASCNQLRPASD